MSSRKEKKEIKDQLDQMTYISVLHVSNVFYVNTGGDMYNSIITQPKSMELRALLWTYPPDENVWGSGVTLTY
jgi:hypothetical protein